MFYHVYTALNLLYLYFQPDSTQQTIIIFLKHFDTAKQTLCGIGKAVVSRNSKVADLIPTINERMRWPPGTPMKLYEVMNALLDSSVDCLTLIFCCRKSSPV